MSQPNKHSLYGTNIQNILLTPEEHNFLNKKNILNNHGKINDAKLQQFKSILKKISKLKLQQNSYANVVKGKALKGKINENVSGKLSTIPAKLNKKSANVLTKNKLENNDFTNIWENVKNIQIDNMKGNQISKSALLLYALLQRTQERIHTMAGKENLNENNIPVLQNIAKKYIELQEEMFLLSELQYVEPPIIVKKDIDDIDNVIKKIVNYHMYKPFSNPVLNKVNNYRNLKNIKNIKNIPIRPTTVNRNTNLTQALNENNIRSIYFINENENVIITKRHHFYYQYKYIINTKKIQSFNPKIVNIEKYIQIHRDNIISFI